MSYKQSCNLLHRLFPQTHNYDLLVTFIDSTLRPKAYPKNSKQSNHQKLLVFVDRSLTLSPPNSCRLVDTEAHLVYSKAVASFLSQNIFFLSQNCCHLFENSLIANLLENLQSLNQFILVKLTSVTVSTLFAFPSNRNLFAVFKTNFSQIEAYKKVILHEIEFKTEFNNLSVIITHKIQKNIFLTLMNDHFKFIELKFTSTIDQKTERQSITVFKKSKRFYVFFKITIEKLIVRSIKKLKLQLRTTNLLTSIYKNYQLVYKYVLHRRIINKKGTQAQYQLLILKSQFINLKKTYFSVITKILQDIVSY